MFSSTRLPLLSRAALVAGAGFLAATAASAGSLDEPTTDEFVPAPPPVPVVTAPDWTGFYGGLQLGYADADGAAGLAGDDISFGLHAGYDYDFGDWVIGGEVDYDQTDLDLNGGAAEVESVTRAKFKGGYDLGNILFYGTAGYAFADTSVGTEETPFYGIGASYRVNERYSIGAELLEHNFDDVGGTPGADLDVTTFTVRGSLRF